MKLYYPKYTEKIWHESSRGEKYQLDSIKKLAAIKEVFSDKSIIIVDNQDERLLHLAHSNELLHSYKTGSPRNLAESSGVKWDPDFFWKWIINKSWASVQSSEEALSNGISVTIQDGGHHAEYGSGYGFNQINSLIISSKYLLQEKRIRKIAILDVDTHYANGTHSLAKDIPELLSTDIWSHKLDKWTYTDTSEHIYHAHVKDAEDYWEALDLMLKRIEAFSPDLVLYYLGLDVLQSDSKGSIHGFKNEEVLRRERIVSNFLKKLAIPYNIYIGGAYVDYSGTEDAAEKQFKNIVDLFKKSIDIHIRQ